MKSRVLGLACAAGLAAGCQSSAAKALSRYQASKAGAGDVAQVSHETTAGLPGPSKRRADPELSSFEVAFEAGEKSLQQFYRDKNDKPAHLQRARASFETAAKTDPTSASAQHRLAIVADLQERFRDSENHYRTALSLDPGNANIAADLGWSCILQERWPDAERALQRALQLDPTSTIARDHLARCRQLHSGADLATTERGAPGQMSANRPAAVGQDRFQAQPPQGNSWQPQPGMPGGPVVPSEHMGEYMRHQMSQVDNAGVPQHGQPLTIGPRPGNEMAYGQQQQQRPSSAPLASQPHQRPPQYAPQPDAPPPYAQQFTQQHFAPAQSPTDQFAPSQYQTDANEAYQRHSQEQLARSAAPAPRGDISRQQEPGGQRYFTHYEPNASAQRPTHQSQGGPSPFPHGNMMATSPRGPQQGDAWANRQQPAHDIQRTQGMELPSQPDHAVYQAPHLPSLPGPDMAQGSTGPSAGQSQYPSSVPPQGYGQPQQHQQPASDPRHAAEALEQTRRNAALMGLGLGPGQLFPSLEQPSDRMAPGSQSQWNGGAFPAPPVHAPDLTPPPDLRQNPSLFDQPAMTPPTNSMGQTLPGGTSSMMTPGSVNDPNARFQQSFVNPAAGQAPQIQSPTNHWNQSGMPGAMQGYDDTRRVTDRQLQQTLQHTWAETPSSAIPTPSSGVTMQQPAAPSQMMQESWGRQPVAPEPYAHAARPRPAARGFEPALPAVNPSPNRTGAPPQNPYPPAGQIAQPVYRDGVVVPEQYGQRGRY